MFELINVYYILCILFMSVTEVDLNDPSTEGEPYDYRFVKWLIKEKVHFYKCIKEKVYI